MTSPDPSPPAAPERKRFPLDREGVELAYHALAGKKPKAVVVHDVERVFHLGLLTDPRDAMTAARGGGFAVEIDESVPAGVVEIRS